MSNNQTRKRLEEAMSQLDIDPHKGRMSIERLFAEMRQERSTITAKLEEAAQRYDAVTRVAQENRGLLQDIQVEVDPKNWTVE